MKNYQLSFTKEDNLCWYIDLPKWPFAHHNLMMVCGADDLCEELSYDNIHTSIDVIISNKEENLPEYICLKKENSSIFTGAVYKVIGSDNVNELWLCPVTLFVFGEYPKYIYLKSNK